MKSILYYIHDPMCSWCWGFSSGLSALLTRLPKEVIVKRILGGLAPDSDEPMPLSMQQAIKASWARIEDTIPGMKFNYNFWTNTTPKRSTYPVCRAVIAAREQGEHYDELMTKAIQRAYYQQARNPSENSTLIKIAAELDLDVTRFEQDLVSNKTEQSLLDEIRFSQELFVESYPSLVFQHGDDHFSIKVNYNNSDVMLEEILLHLESNT